MRLIRISTFCFEYAFQVPHHRRFLSHSSSRLWHNARKATTPCSNINIHFHNSGTTYAIAATPFGLLTIQYSSATRFCPTPSVPYARYSGPSPPFA